MSEDDSDLSVSDQLVGSDQPIQGVIHCGQLALARLEQNQTWLDWCAVIKALVKGREICREASGGHDKGRRFNKAMGRWLRCYGFDRIDKSDRSRFSDALTTSKISIPGAQDDRSPSSLNSIILVSSSNAGSAS